MARFGDFDQYLDNAGDPLAEGKLYFYESGTTTPKTTYADINNSIPNTNPVLLSAAGRQPNIFFDGVAKVILTDNDDVQIAVRDPAGETGTDFGDEWVATKIYNAVDVVLGSDGTYYRSLINGNQNNNPVTTSGSWTLLYSVEWNAGITYQVGAVVTYDGEQYQSLQGSNLNQNPSSASSYWVLLSFAWLATATYSEDQNAVGTDGILYTSLQDSNTGNDPATSPTYWVGTSAAAAASAIAAAASAAAALVSENAAAADAIATAADRVQTGLDAAATAADAIATAADRVQTGLDAAATAADVILTNADAVATAADRVQTGLDAAATSADAIATAADRVQTGLDVIATNADASSTAADAVATAADRVQTGLDATATAADRVQTGLDATAAASSATAATGSATAAAGSATDAADKYDEFDDRYLGEKASDPTLDNDGNALITGALYFNTSTDAMKVYTGSVWQDIAPVATSVTVSQISDYTGTATELNYTDGVTSSIQTQLDAKAVYPDQTGNSGKFLTTDGTDSSWDIALPDETGNAGKFLTTDGTDASWVDLSASPTHQATASGSLADGDLVVVNSDGTVSSVEGNLAEFSNAATWWSGTAPYYHSTAYDPDTGAYILMAIPGAGSSNPGYNVATISGNTITVGTLSTLTTSAAAYGKVVYNELWNKVAFISQNGYSWGTVDAVNRTVTWQSVGGFTNWTQYGNSLNYDDVTGRMIQIGSSYNGDYQVRIFYSSTGSNMYASSPITVNTTNTSGAITFKSTVNLGNSKFLTAAPMGTNLGLRSFITTITGNTTATFGSFQSVFGGVTCNHSIVAYSPDSNKALILYKDFTNSYYLTYRLGTVNGGSSVSWGSAIVIATSNNSGFNAVYDANSQKFIIWSGTSDKSMYEGVYTSGNELTLTKTMSNYTGVTANNNSYAQFVMDTANNKVIWNAGSKVADYSPESTNLTEGNYIGISNGSYSDAETATVQVAGSVDDAQSGLTAGQKYYAVIDGTLSTTAGTPEVVVGTSVSSSEIIVKG